MKIMDLVPPTQEGWLKWVTRKFSGGVAKLYLIYDEHKFGMDTARDIANSVLSEDFVPEEDSFEILSNEQIRIEAQQGIHRPFGGTLGAFDHQWWIEVYLDRDIWDLVVPEYPGVPKPVGKIVDLMASEERGQMPVGKPPKKPVKKKG